MTAQFENLTLNNVFYRVPSLLSEPYRSSVLLYQSNDNLCDYDTVECKNSYKDACSATMWHYFLTHRQGHTLLQKKLLLRDRILTQIRKNFVTADMFMVGSSMNGFGTENSDLDLCLTIDAQEINQKEKCFDILKHLMCTLKSLPFIRDTKLIRAKVSILKFFDIEDGVECDLNINSVTGIYNTHLMAMYTRIDWRLRPLVLVVKHWAACLDIHDASLGRLSSYSLSLMVIHYLQAGVRPAVLPALQKCFPTIFNYERPPHRVDMRLQLPFDELKSSNEMSLLELFQGFVEYYAENFDFENQSISIRSGQLLSIDVALQQLPEHERLLAARNFKIFVEEPFTLLNTAHSLYDGQIFHRVLDVFRLTLCGLKEGKDLADLLNMVL